MSETEAKPKVDPRIRGARASRLFDLIYGLAEGKDNVVDNVDDVIDTLASAQELATTFLKGLRDNLLKRSAEMENALFSDDGLPLELRDALFETSVLPDERERDGEYEAVTISPDPTLVRVYRVRRADDGSLEIIRSDSSRTHWETVSLTIEDLRTPCTVGDFEEPAQ